MTRAHAAASAMYAVFVLLAQSAVGAEPPRLMSNEGRADQLFHSGEKKFDAGDYAGACSDFSESLKLGPRLGTLLNLALCHEMTGRLVTAWSEFSHGAAWAAQNGQRDRLDFATQHVRSLEPRLPRIVLQLPAHRAIDGLDIDGEPVAEPRWYLPLYLDPGEHQLAVSAPGKRRTTVAFRVTMSPSDQIVLVPPLDDAPIRGKADSTTDETRRAVGIGGLGLGAAGIAVGTVFGVLAISGEERDPVIQDRATVATVAFLAGAAFAGVGGWLVWTSTHARVTPRSSGASLGWMTSF